jgi:deoxyribonuclease V
MILAIDVHYSENTAYIAGIAFEDWCSEFPDNEFVSTLFDVEKYEPGNFYRRELPCILKLIEEHNLKQEVIVVDGYVFLDGGQRPGLGKYLYDSLNCRTKVIGVAKRSFSCVGKNHEVFRGKSIKPLYITTTGKLDTAKDNISSMFGENRIPVLLKRADQLCREESKKHLIQTPKSVTLCSNHTKSDNFLL